MGRTSDTSDTSDIRGVLRKVELERRIFSHYGERHQKLKLIEEMAELTQAILKGDPKHMAEEMADVQILLDQLRMGMEMDGIIAQFIDMKLARQIARLNAPKGQGGIDIPPELENAFKTPSDGHRDETTDGSGCDPTDWG